MDLSKTEISDFDLFLRVNSDLFCYCFQGDQRWLDPNEYCYTCMCSLVAQTGNSSFLFCFEGSFLRNRNGGWILAIGSAVLFRNYSTLSSSQTKVWSFPLPVSFCSGFLLSTDSIIRKVRTPLLRGTSTLSNTEERH